MRAQEDLNLRPLEPQSNALSGLSYGHIAMYDPRSFTAFGEGGIRTHGARNRHNSLAGSPIQPLSHLSVIYLIYLIYCYLINTVLGERGIRTPGPVRDNGFQDRRFRPLSHLSSTKIDTGKE